MILLPIQLKDKKSGIKVGKLLIKKTLKDIKYLKDISISDDLQYQSISDKLSNQILECGMFVSMKQEMT